jgi:hypothetical protein
VSYSKTQFNHSAPMAVFVVEFYGGQVLAIQDGCIEFRCSGFHEAREILKGLRKEVR